MKLIPIKPAHIGSTSANVVITCHECGTSKPWNLAASHLPGELGWTADLHGKPYIEYYCPNCANRKMHSKND